MAQMTYIRERDLIFKCAPTFRVVKISLNVARHVYNYIRGTLFKVIIYGKEKKRQAHTCRHSAALRKELRDSWDTCTSPRYMNSRRDAILWALVPSRITISPAGEGGIPSKSS